MLNHTTPFAELIRKEVFERPDFKEAKLSKVDPIHLASVVSGATVFFVAAMPALLPDRSFDPTSHAQLDAHKDELIRIVRRLAGTRQRPDVHAWNSPDFLYSRR